MDAGLLGLIHKVADEHALELVDVRQGGGAGRPVLRVRVDLPDARPGHGITLDQCAALSRSLEHALEEAGAVGPRYVLEVSSPGVERPVRWPEHWRRYRGRGVRVSAAGLGKRVTAVIADVPDDDHVVLRRPDGREVTVSLADVREATLVVDWTAIGKP